MRIRQWLLKPEHVMVRRGMCHLRRGEAGGNERPFAETQWGLGGHKDWTVLASGWSGTEVTADAEDWLHTEVRTELGYRMSEDTV